MTTTKEAVQKVVDALPAEITIDDPIRRMILMQSFEEGRKQYEAGNYFTHEEVKQQFTKWLQ